MVPGPWCPPCEPAQGGAASVEQRDRRINQKGGPAPELKSLIDVFFLISAVRFRTVKVRLRTE
jgi:hypothetical protein